MADFGTIGTAYVQIEPSARGIAGKLSGEMESAGQAGGSSFASGFGKVVGGAGAAVAGAVAAGTAAVGAFAASSIEAGKSFDSSMAQVAATMGTTVDQIGDLRDFAQEMGSTTAFSATEAADALNYMALAGYDADTSMKMLPNVLNLAAAGGIDLASASDMVTDAQTALGLSIEETSSMVDQMAKASSKSNTSVAQLGDAFLTIGANARNLKGGTQELSTVLGVLADNGIKGSEAGTHLRNIMLAMNPTTDKAAAAWEELGVKAYDADGNLRDLPTIFQELNDSMDGWSTEEKTAQLSAMFNKTDLASINALLGTTGDRYKELSGAIGDASGAAQAMADTQLDNLEGDITLFKSALEGAQIAVADQLTPTFREFVKFGGEGLGQLTQAFKEGGLEGAMSTFGDLLSQLLTKVTSLIPEMINAGMQLLGALGQGLIENLPQIVDAAVQIGVMFLDGLVPALPAMMEGGLKLIDSLAQSFEQNSGKMMEIGQKMLQMLSNGLTTGLPMLMQYAVTLVQSLAAYIGEHGSEMVQSAATLIRDFIAGLVDSIPELMSGAADIIVGLVTALTDPGAITQLVMAAGELIMGLANGLLEALPKLIDAIPQIISNLVAALVAALPEIIIVGVQLLIALTTGLIQAIPRLVAAIPAILLALVGGLKRGVEQIAEVGKDMVAGLWKGIKDRWSALVEDFKNLASGLVDGIKGLFGINSPSKVFAEEVGQWIPAGVAVGVEDGMGVLDKAMGDMTSEMMSASVDPTIVGGSYYASDIDNDPATGLYNLLAEYLPIIASGENMNLSLEGDAAGLFNLVRRENKVYKRMNGESAFA